MVRGEEDGGRRFWCRETYLPTLLIYKVRYLGYLPKVCRWRVVSNPIQSKFFFSSSSYSYLSCDENSLYSCVV